MALEDDIALLGKTPVFCHLQKEALRLLAFAAENVQLVSGQLLFVAGDRSDGGYVVREGELSIDAGDGKNPTIVGRGTLIGQTALFARVTRQVSVRALTTAGLFRISSNLMKRCLEEYPAGAEIIFASISGELHNLTSEMMKIRNTYLPEE
jgi:CRP-like cAMP-binding protein